MSVSSGYCLADVYAGKKNACSDCYLRYGATLQENDYGRSRMPEKAFKELLALCKADPAKYPYSYTSLPPLGPSGGTTTTATTSSAPSKPTCTGKTYTVQAGDSCASIAKAQSMSSDRLVDVNYLDFGCTTLVQGMKLCIQDTCKLTTVQMNQTCNDVLAGTGASVVQFTSWNP